MWGLRHFNYNRWLAWARKIVVHPRVMQVRTVAADLVSRLLSQLQKRPRRVAVTISLGLHIGLLLLLLIHPPKGFAGGGANGVGMAGAEGVGVSLVGADDFYREAMTAKAQPEEAEDITPLELVESVDALMVSKVEPLPQLISDDVPDALKDQELAQSATGAPGTGRSGQNGASGDDLWGKIAPCWRKVADANTLPVTLQMSFDATGRLSVPPTIERDPMAPIDMRSQVSEAKALEALRDCGAYAMAAGRENVKVNFPRP